MNDFSFPFAVPDFMSGSVWLVGAGPGDPGLLSVLAVHALIKADIVVHDALIDPSILTLARPSTIIEDVGKRCGKSSTKQDEISRRLVEYARQGLRVLRLKGGDPFVFGRGAEEALYLAKNNICFRIVPGISSGIGGLAYAGIPATARDVNHVVSFVTGHDIHGKIPSDLDWKSLAKGSPVLVFYMALRHLEEIVGHLLRAGRDEGEPAAVISKATHATQRVVTDRLDNIASTARRAALEAPALFVVGPVVAYRQHLAWLEEQFGS